MSSARLGAIVVAAWCGFAACQAPPPSLPPPAADRGPPLATSSTLPPVVSANANANANAASPRAATSASAKFRHTPHTGPLPDVPPALLALRDVVKDLGPIRVGETESHEPSIVCKGCIEGDPEADLVFVRPAVSGSFSAAGKKELVLDAQGSCGVQGHQWGCLLLVDEGPKGRVVSRVHPARSGSTQVHAHRIEGERDLLVGLFAGWQQGGSWTEAFAIDFANESPSDHRMVELFVTEGCGDDSIGLQTSSGAIEKVLSVDANGDGILDLVVSGKHGEIVLRDPHAECRKPKSPTERPFTIRLLRQRGLWGADAASDKLLTPKYRLRAFGVKGQGPTGVE